MKLNILFPCDYFEKHQVDADFRGEYEMAKLVGFDCYLLDVQKFEEEALPIIYPEVENITLLYRGWMMQDYLYINFAYRLKNLYKVKLMVTPYGYREMHYFNYAYPAIKHRTPKMLYANPGYFDFPLIKKTFKDFFIMKDNVKSVKGFDFPSKIPVDISEKEFNALVLKFIEIRGKLFAGQIILKQFVNLKKYGDKTNEFRAFYFLNELLTLSRNSNQPENVNQPLESLVREVSTLFASQFFTVDFAELETGEWMVLETGDGQVSGLSPNQNILEFYTKMSKIEPIDMNDISA